MIPPEPNQDDSLPPRAPSAEIMVEAFASSVRLTRNRSPTVLDLLASNAKSLWKLKLYKAPDFLATSLVHALQNNTTVTTVDVTWTFLRNFHETDRVLILKAIGQLTNLENLTLEVVGPTCILTVALQNATNLKSLSVGKLRFATNQDVTALSQSLCNCQELQQLSLSSIQILVQGNHVLGDDGMVRFLETEDQRPTKKIVLDPLLESMADLPRLAHIRLQHYLHGKKIQSISQKSLRALCHAPRESLIFNACGLVDEHCTALADELVSPRASPTLSILVVSRNYRITSSGWDSLINMLKGNYTIVDFHTGDVLQINEPSPEQKFKIAHFLKLNMAGRGKLLTDVSGASRDAWVNFLIKGRDDLDLLVYALQTNPSLCQF